MRKTISTVVAALGCIAVQVSSGQTANEVVEWSAQVDSTKPLRIGQGLWVSITANIERGWHVYSMTQPKGGPHKLEIAVPEGQAFKQAGRALGPRPEAVYDSTFRMNMESYRGTTVFKLPVIVDSVAQGVLLKASIDVTFQACSDRLCLTPATIRLPVHKR